jgi:hypothetical protein
VVGEDRSSCQTARRPFERAETPAMRVPRRISASSKRCLAELSVAFCR